MEQAPMAREAVRVAAQVLPAGIVLHVAREVKELMVVADEEWPCHAIACGDRFAVRLSLAHKHRGDHHVRESRVRPGQPIDCRRELRFSQWHHHGDGVGGRLGVGEDRLVDGKTI